MVKNLYVECNITQYVSPNRLCEREGKGIETIFSNYRKELLTTPVLSTDSEKTLFNLNVTR